MSKIAINLLGQCKLVYSDYYKPSLYIPIGITCTGKCFKDLGIESVNCQNWCLNKTISIDSDVLVNNIVSKKLAEAYVFSGKEPFDNFEQMLKLIYEIRFINYKDIVIYTGYYECEISSKINLLKIFPNVIIKFGRYIPDSEPIVDPILKIALSSNNQFAKVISICNR